jgi:hypothetical protein
VTLIRSDRKDPENPEVEVGGELLVLVQPHLQHDGRRKWAVMAVYDSDEMSLALNLANAYEGRGHIVAVAQLLIESEG